MLAKVLVLASIAFASCEYPGYATRAEQYQPANQYRHNYGFVPVRQEEPDQETHYSNAPKNYGYTFSSQNINHQTAHTPYHTPQEESQEINNEHVAPVYQYEQEEEAPAKYGLQANHYQNFQYAAPSPIHYASQHHAASHDFRPHFAVDSHPVQPQYSHGQEEQTYGHDAQVHKAPVYQTHSAEKHTHESHEEPVDFHAHPKYQFEYKVEDPHSGDNKYHHEYRDGDVVKGVYTVQEPDGSIRIVEYSSDKHKGFNAIVKHTAPGQQIKLQSHHDS